MQWVGLVRNVMLGRQGLSRAVLLEAVGDAGGREPRSYLTTGNISFVAPPGDLDDVVERIEAGVAAALGRAELVAVRSLDALRDLVAVDRFAAFAGEDWETEVSFLRHDAPPLDERRIAYPRQTVIVDVRPHEVLAARPRSGGARPHVNRLLEEATGCPATARGWSTLRRVVAALDG
ncbi:DUF1697 domain-containing protein [Nocardioides panacisoli]|uniref:DUF1697 domain-containing protein n=1 Tax=Nocardioides panacisoli TaxID=627624 RepID=A0ABP7I769_9ACTN